ncbi:MAG: hypothetical protein IT536_03125 [Hyphomicrobiales bacterium]|nr:hypothetical protein [Hyphomicrobiales bacterium]
MYFRKKTSGGRAYLQIVESRREGTQVRQQVIATLGRVDDLRESRQLERLLRSCARFAAKAIGVDALNDGNAIAAAVRRITSCPWRLRHIEFQHKTIDCVAPTNSRVTQEPR